MKLLLLLPLILLLPSCGLIGSITLNPDGTTDVEVTIPPAKEAK